MVLSKAKDEGRRSRPNNPGGETEKKINEVRGKSDFRTDFEFSIVNSNDIFIKTVSES